MSNSIKRREFFKKASAAGIGLSVFKAIKPFTSLHAANNTINLAVAGTNGRGASLAATVASLIDCEVIYICDPEEKALQKGVEAVKSVTGKTPKAIKDFRQALENKSLDGIIIAAPDHWHTPATLLALQAGKHVYVEKPCGHNPKEGELLMLAADKYKNLIIQMGNQRRSSPLYHEAMAALHDGIIGKTYFAKAWYANARESIGHGKKVDPPPNLDWELWQGPAPRRPYRDNYVHYNWHWFWHWGTGESCNNATHELDVCRWALEADYPYKVTSAGGRYHFSDDWEAYDSQVLCFEFPDDKLITWESHSCNPYKTENNGRGVLIFGTHGTMLITEGTYSLYDLENNLIKKVGKGGVEGLDPTSPSADMDALHLQNFLDCIRSGAKPNSLIREGHKSVILCHLGNIAQKCGGLIECDPRDGHIKDTKIMQQHWSREYEPGWEPVV